MKARWLPIAGDLRFTELLRPTSCMTHCGTSGRRHVVSGLAISKTKRRWRALIVLALPGARVRARALSPGSSSAFQASHQRPLQPLTLAYAKSTAPVHLPARRRVCSPSSCRGAHRRCVLIYARERVRVAAALRRRRRRPHARCLRARSCYLPPHTPSPPTRSRTRMRACVAAARRRPRPRTPSLPTRACA
jgi:hypothetical protein